MPGNPTFEGQQVLTHYACNISGCVAECFLWLDTGIDLYFQGAQVRAKVSASGACLRSEWTNVAASMYCEPGCGAISLNLSQLSGTQDFFPFSHVPSFAHIHTDFGGEIHAEPAIVGGDTPQIRCSFTENQCKFQ